MAIHIYCLLSSLLLASVGAEVYDQGPQTFFESSSPSSQPEQRADREYVLYLTPNQAKSLESAGAWVKPQPLFEPEIPQREPQVIEEQEQPEYEQRERIRSEEPKQEPESELEEIFKLLNEQKSEEQQEQATERPRDAPAPFKVIPKAQDNKKYLAPNAAKTQGPAKSYSYVRYLSNSEDVQNLRKPYRVHPAPSYYNGKGQDSAQRQEETRTTEAPEIQEDKLSSLLKHRKLSAQILQHRDRLLKNELELQSTLREIQDAPKYNDQKYAIEIEKLRSNLEKQNALFKAEAIAKAAPVSNQEESSVKPRRPVEVVKNVEAPVPSPVVVRVPQPYEVKFHQPYALPVEIVQPVPIVKTQNIQIENPVEVEKRHPVSVTKNVYVKVEKPYFVERYVPVESKKDSEEVSSPQPKPQKLTIVRHIWEH